MGILRVAKCRRHFLSFLTLTATYPSELRHTKNKSRFVTSFGDTRRRDSVLIRGGEGSRMSAIKMKTQVFCSLFFFLFIKITFPVGHRNRYRYTLTCRAMRGRVFQSAITGDRHFTLDINQGPNWNLWKFKEFSLNEEEKEKFNFFIFWVTRCRRIATWVIV